MENKNMHTVVWRHNKKPCQTACSFSMSILWSRNYFDFWHVQGNKSHVGNIQFCISSSHTCPYTATFWSNLNHNWTPACRDMNNSMKFKNKVKHKRICHFSSLQLKINFSDIRLIPLDHVTYYCMPFQSTRHHLFRHFLCPRRVKH